MKNTMIFLLCTLSCSIYAEQLRIVSSSAVCEKVTEGKKKYKYTLGLVLENSSTKELSVITEFPRNIFGGIESISNDKGEIVSFRFGAGYQKYQGKLLIPSESSLAIVNLRSAELTRVSSIVYSNRKVMSTKLKIAYSTPSDIATRMNVWSGAVIYSVPEIVFVDRCS